MNRIDKLRDIFSRLALPSDKLLIAGSTPLSLFNIIKEDSVSDFDVLVTDPEVWKKIEALGPAAIISNKSFHGQRILFNDKLTGETVDFINSWPMAGKSTERLMDKKMVINDLSFMSLEHVIRTKLSMDREKDRQHLNLIRNWLHASRINGNEHLPSKIQMRVYRDIARGLAVNIPKIDS